MRSPVAFSSPWRVDGGVAVTGTLRATLLDADGASWETDVRVWKLAEAERVDIEIRALSAHHLEARIEVTGGFHRPPMERSPASAALMQRAREIARGLGQELAEGPAGGASDANLISALGVATLDGLGAMGGGAHSANEHVELDSLVPRTALLVALLLDL
jgi:glutamate carboxypeptidase